MVKNRALARILAPLVISAAVLAGCGSSDSDDARDLGDPITAESGDSGSGTTSTTERTSTTSAGPLVSGATTFVDPQGTYSIDISPTWTEQSGTVVSEVEAWLIGLGDTQFQDNVNVLTQETQGRDLQEYLDFSTASMGDMELISETIVTGTAGNELALLEYSGVLPGAPIPLHALATVSVDDGTAIIATLTTTLDTFEEARAEAERYLLTLQQTSPS